MKIVIAIALTAAPSLMAATDEPPVLAHNPFARPPSDVVIETRSAPVRDEITSSEFVLHATMIGSNNKLANVGGRILKTGDEIHGHVLVAIHERYAVFRRNGQDTTVYVKPQLVENNE